MVKCVYCMYMSVFVEKQFVCSLLVVVMFIVTDELVGSKPNSSDLHYRSSTEYSHILLELYW